jgi:GNAT superfamily N-acetyltransferase
MHKIIPSVVYLQLNMKSKDYKIEQPAKELTPIIKKFVVGIDDDLVNQLIKKSRQDHIKSSTPKDISERFGDIKMFTEWNEQGRVMHWLVGDNDDLAGVIWYGKKKFPNDNNQKVSANNTFAIRIYEGYAGQGLAKPFMKQSLQLYLKSLKNNHDDNVEIWLSTSVNNFPAIAVYTKFGYKEIYRTNEQVFMILPQEVILGILA